MGTGVRTLSLPTAPSSCALLSHLAEPGLPPRPPSLALMLNTLGIHAASFRAKVSRLHHELPHLQVQELRARARSSSHELLIPLAGRVIYARIPSVLIWPVEAQRDGIIADMHIHIWSLLLMSELIDVLFSEDCRRPRPVANLQKHHDTDIIPCTKNRRRVARQPGVHASVQRRPVGCL